MKIHHISTAYQNKPLIKFLEEVKRPCLERVYESDPKDQKIRDTLREWHYDNLVPTIIHGEENPMSTGQETNAAVLKILNISKYGYGYLIEPFKLPDYKNSYRGISLVDDKENLERIKKYGIKTVIDLGYGDNSGDLVENCGMRYVKCPYDLIIDEDWYENIWGTNEECLNYIVDTINAMREGDFYISCRYFS